MIVRLPYGHDQLQLNLVDLGVDLLEPSYMPGLLDEHASFLQCLRDPIGTPHCATLSEKGRALLSSSLISRALSRVIASFPGSL